MTSINSNNSKPARTTAEELRALMKPAATWAAEEDAERVFDAQIIGACRKAAKTTTLRRGLTFVDFIRAKKTSPPKSGLTFGLTIVDFIRAGSQPRRTR